MAESLDDIATDLEKATKGDTKKLNAAAQKLLQRIIKENGDVIFNGNNYAEEWHQEAARRGLPNLKSSVQALPVIGSKEVVALMEKYKVLSKRETHSRMDIYVEQYCKAVNVEANLMIEMARTKIYPAAMRYQGELAATAASLKARAIHPTRTLNQIISDQESAREHRVAGRRHESPQRKVTAG